MGQPLYYDIPGQLYHLYSPIWQFACYEDFRLLQSDSGIDCVYEFPIVKEV